MGLVPGRLYNVNLTAWQLKDPHGLGKRVPMYQAPSFASRMVHGVMVPETTVIYLESVISSSGYFWFKVIYGEAVGWIRCGLDEILQEKDACPESLGTL